MSNGKIQNSCNLYDRSSVDAAGIISVLGTLQKGERRDGNPPKSKMRYEGGNSA